eukprot:jgi/Tetstr1/446176/TSEL_003577.t1
MHAIGEGVQVNMWTSYRARNTILREDDASYVEDYQLIAPWLQKREANGNRRCIVVVDADGAFEYCILINCHAPKRCVGAGTRVSGVDGAHLKHKIYKGVSLALQGRDRNGKNVLVGCAFCPLENPKYHSTFIAELKELEPHVNGKSLKFGDWLDSV